jgi:hypothetical protein
MTATRTIERPNLWGVGTYRAAGEIFSYPVSYADIERDIASATRALQSLGVEAGSPVLIVSALSETAQYWPVLVATMALGGQLSSAEATRFDAFRTAMFLRARRYRAVVGISGEVLDGLADIGASPAEVFANADVVAARGEALERLRDAGIVARAWLHVGPALAVECDQAGGAHLDQKEWSAVEQDGEIVLGAVNPRTATIHGLRTGVWGLIENAPCPCGRTDPRIVLTHERSPT